MADRGKWLKLWLDSLTDLDIAKMSNDDWGFLTRLWMLIKKEGEAGSITLERPAVIPCALVHVPDFDALIKKIETSIPCRNVTISNRYKDGIVTVTFANWLKYQGDWSGDRVKKFRKKSKKCNGKPSSSYSSSSSNNINPNKEEKKSAPNGLSRFDEFWPSYPKKVGKQNAEKEWKHLTEEEKEKAIRTVKVYPFKPGFILDPERWIKYKRFDDDLASIKNQKATTENYVDPFKALIDKKKAQP